MDTKFIIYSLIVQFWACSINSLGLIADISVWCLHKLMGIYMEVLLLGIIH